ncbi:hypothetical protein HNW13_017945 [Shewanella sp. BF02_Schw]|uniref:hypothetical protein n=1 Tax=Shewanella sp. BF02_Schw TaxID=394908 RepID=UPI0017869736|nr:hypothetical protein [Shewanella sp. BF02_Schw]MBO1897622.1 hypothetical protein [Shewanella sp. BF02_Schw]
MASVYSYRDKEKQGDLSWTSHGLITEIITIGSLSSEDGIITPCTKSYETYDYTIESKSGYKYKVSIKNFDISVHERAFIEESKIINKMFQNLLQHYQMSGSLRLVCEISLTRKMTLDICIFIASSIKSYGHFYPIYGCMVSFVPLYGYDSSLLVNGSGTVTVLSKQHRNEQRNIESKIKSANDKMLKDPVDANSIKQLVIRLGETTDINRIKSFIQDIADDYERCGFDMCLIFQSSVVADLKDNTSNINTTIAPIGRSFYPETESIKEKLKNIGFITMSLGIGTVSTGSMPLKLVVDGQLDEGDVSNYYVLQQGDIYLKMKKDASGLSAVLSHPAPGIAVHAVHENFTIKGAVFPVNNKLLIV